MRTPLPYVVYKGTKVHPGHPCKVEASPGRKDGYDTLIKAIWGDPERKTMEVDVIDHYTGGLRTYPVARVRPYLRNVEKIKERILVERRKKLGFRGGEESNGTDKRKPKRQPTRAR